MHSLTAPALLAPTVDALRSETLPFWAYLDGVFSRIEAVEHEAAAVVGQG